MKNRSAAAFVVASLLLTAVGVRAQEAAAIDTTRLQSLYEQLLRNPENAYLQESIAAERKKIRALIDKELEESIVTPQEAEATEEGLTGTLELQSALTEKVRDSLQNATVDADLLTTEEDLYTHPESTGTGVTFRLTKTHGELLARKAILEERIASLSSFLELQEDRLSGLQREYWLEQFSVVIGIGKYVFVVFLVWLAVSLIRGAILRRVRDENRRYSAAKIVSGIAYGMTALWLLGVFLSRYPNAIASLAIVGAGLAIALQDAVKDVLGWAMILKNRLYSRGDRISIGNVTGEVIDISLLRTTLLEVGLLPTDHYAVLERTGKSLTIPNMLVLSQPLTNHHTTSDFVRAEMRFSITYESNWRKAKTILEQILEETTSDFLRQEMRQKRERARHFYIPHRTSGNQVYLDVAADGIELTLRFSVPVGERRPVVSQITDAILERFNAEPDITLAYHTMRLTGEIAT